MATPQLCSCLEGYLLFANDDYHNPACVVVSYFWSFYLLSWRVRKVPFMRVSMQSIFVTIAVIWLNLQPTQITILETCDDQSTNLASSLRCLLMHSVTHHFDQYSHLESQSCGSGALDHFYVINLGIRHFQWSVYTLCYANIRTPRIAGLSWTLELPKRKVCIPLEW